MLHELYEVVRNTTVVAQGLLFLSMNRWGGDGRLPLPGSLCGSPIAAIAIPEVALGSSSLPSPPHRFMLRKSNLCATTVLFRTTLYNSCNTNNLHAILVPECLTDASPLAEK